MQSFNLQILEKWSQEFDGMVGQDNRQNPKALVSLKQKKKSMANGGLFTHYYFNASTLITHKKNYYYLII